MTPLSDQGKSVKNFSDKSQTLDIFCFFQDFDEKSVRTRGRR